MVKRKTRTKLMYGSEAHYWPKQMKPPWIAVALISVVADSRQAARERLAEAGDFGILNWLKTWFKQVMAETHHTA